MRRKSGLLTVHTLTSQWKREGKTTNNSPIVGSLTRRVGSGGNGGRRTQGEVGRPRPVVVAVSLPKSPTQGHGRPQTHASTTLSYTTDTHYSGNGVGPFLHTKSLLSSRERDHRDHGETTLRGDPPSGPECPTLGYTRLTPPLSRRVRFPRHSTTK